MCICITGYFFQILLPGEKFNMLNIQPLAQVLHKANHHQLRPMMQTKLFTDWSRVVSNLIV